MLLSPHPLAAPAGNARTGRDLLFVVLAAAAVTAGVAGALQRSWTADDAYISFRYAANLTHGHGLVFNAGERVEGYSNFLWTLWCALGLRLGAAPERWAATSGIACFALTIMLLAARAWRRRAMLAGLVVPAAALALAFHPDARAFATGGLETACFTLLVVLAYLLLTGSRTAPARCALAGVALALVAMTRPDGVLFAGLGIAWLALFARDRARSVLAGGVAMLALLLPYALWKLAYYGTLWPNTFYAKSAARAWWSQGFAYVWLYFQRYPVLLAGLPLGAWAFARGAAGSRDARAAGDRRGELALAAAWAVGYTVYVAYIGGDFMFARFLVPVTPFCLILAEAALEALLPGRAAARASAAAALALAVALAPRSLPAGAGARGIGDEQAYYATPERAAARRMGEALRRYGAGLPLRLAFGGTQAIVAYGSGAPVAIEATTGLTDRWIARQPLVRRGRVGHEKRAPWPYLIETRHAHLVPGRSQTLTDSLSAYIPVMFLWLDEVPFTLLTWDPPFMDSLAARGAVVPDFPARLDEFLRALPGVPEGEVSAEYAKLRRFYFDRVRDPEREGLIRRRLAGGAPEAPPRPGP